MMIQCEIIQCKDYSTMLGERLVLWEYKGSQFTQKEKEIRTDFPGESAPTLQ